MDGALHRELCRKDVTLTPLLEEYKAAHSQGLQYSRFCERYTGPGCRLSTQ